MKGEVHDIESPLILKYLNGGSVARQLDGQGFKSYPKSSAWGNGAPV